MFTYQVFEALLAISLHPGRGAKAVYHALVLLSMASQSMVHQCSKWIDGGAIDMMVDLRRVVKGSPSLQSRASQQLVSKVNTDRFQPRRDHLLHPTRALYWTFIHGDKPLRAHPSLCTSCQKKMQGKGHSYSYIYIGIVHLIKIIM